MTIKLRKKAPFHCRAPKTPGSTALCLAVLMEADGDLCPGCADAAKKAHDRFWNRPVSENRPDPVAEVPARRIWP